MKKFSYIKKCFTELNEELFLLDKTIVSRNI
jgi:hypothetical protein